MAGLITPGTRWLDVGCGTGYYLGLFPQTERCGLDLSAHMLAEAARANTQNCTLVEGDFREVHSQWQGAWSLVSCMWGAYCYVPSLADSRTVLLNMVSWLQPGGNLFLPILDMESLRDNLSSDYEAPVQIFGGSSKIKAFNWTWVEEEWGLEHEMLSPTLGYILELLQPHFREIEIVMCPYWSKGFRKILVAKGRKTSMGKPAIVRVVESPKPPVPTPWQVGLYHARKKYHWLKACFKRLS